MESSFGEWSAADARNPPVVAAPSVRTGAGEVRLPLPALLSVPLVAFTIELDNEAEHRMPKHRTTRGRAAPDAPRGPWLTSFAMWTSCLRYVGPAGIRVRERERLAGVATNLPGLQRWGYVVVAPDPDDPRPEPPPEDWLIRLTPAGRRAQEVWRPLPGEIEQRWRERFGSPADRWRAALGTLYARLDPALPDSMPILGYAGYGLRTGFTRQPGPGPTGSPPPEAPSIPQLLSRPLVGFAGEFETESRLSLAITLDLLRVLGTAPLPRRDLPRLTGVSKEALAIGLGVLERAGLATTGPDPAGSRRVLVWLTPRGRAARERRLRLVADIEERWRARFGSVVIDELRAASEPLVGDGTRAGCPLFAGLDPYPENWRAGVRPAETLPWFPMMLHRGGYPDGS